MTQFSECSVGLVGCLYRPTGTEMVMHLHLHLSPTPVLGQLSLHPSGIAKLSANFSWGKGRNVTSAGCDFIWHVNFRSGEASC